MSMIQDSQVNHINKKQNHVHFFVKFSISGTGMFGDVFLAKARGIRDVEPETLVVVKSLLVKDEQLYFEYRQQMDMYCKLDHPFVIKLLGVCREMEPQFMITEYCDWVSVMSLMLKNCWTCVERWNLTVHDHRIL